MNTQEVHLVEVLDSFNLIEKHISRQPWREGMTVYDVYPTPIGSAEIAVSVNGALVPFEKRQTTLISPGDWVGVMPVPEGGGGGGKAILRIVAIIAFAVVTAGAGLAIAGAAGFTAGTTAFAVAAGVAQVGVTIAGAMLINAVLPMPKPKSGSQNFSDSPSYGADGAKNTSAEGVPVPVVYGTYRVAGNILGAYVVNSTETQSFSVGSTAYNREAGKQYLHMLLNFGEGPISQISDIQINDQPLASFTYVPAGTTTEVPAYEFKDTFLGSATQTSPNWFDRSVTPRGFNQKLTDVFFQTTTADVVDRLRIDLACPGGLFNIDGNGNTAAANVTVEIQYRPFGSTTWLPFPGNFGAETNVREVFTPRSVTVTRDYNKNGSALSRASWTYTGNNTYVYKINGSETRVGNTLVDSKGAVVADITVATAPANGLFTINSTVRSVVRKSITSTLLTEGKYDVRIRRTTVESVSTTLIDQIALAEINEIKLETVGYRNTALLPIKILMTDKLNSVPKVTALVKGRIIRSWNKTLGVFENVHSANPAWIALDGLTHTRYGGRAALARFDLDKWKEWADYCDANSLQFNGVFDTTQSGWDAMQNVFRVGHAQIVPQGTKFSVIVEKPDTPVMLFSVANMIDGTFKINWLPVAERANEVELSYMDKDDGYKQHTVKAVDTFAASSGANQRTAQVTMMGITSAQQAWNEATFMLNMNRYILQTIEFSAPSEVLACSVGDVVLVQHDMPAWGAGGRTIAGSTTTVVNLDREVTLNFGKTYQLLVHFSQVAKATGAITSVTGTSIVLGGYTGTTSVRRLLVGTKDMAVTSIFQSGANFGVTVDDASGVLAGATYTLYNTDEIVTRAVINSTTSLAPTAVVTSVTLSTALPGAPAQFTNWTFGETLKNAKPFRIRSIGGDDAVNREVSAIEYNESMYSPAGTVPTPNYSSLNDIVEQAVITGVREELKSAGGDTFKSLVTISFGPAKPSSNYSRSEVLVSVGTTPWRSLGFFVSEASVEASTEDIVRFRVIARDLMGRSAEGATAPETSYRVSGASAESGAVTGAIAAFEDTGLRLSWNPSFAADWSKTQIRVGASWSVGQVVYDQKGTSIVLPFFTAAGTYVHTFKHILGSNIDSAVTEATLNVVVTAPKTPAVTATQVQSGSVTVLWGSLQNSQRIKTHEVRVGSTFATATIYANYAGDSTGATLSFQGDGSRVIWVRAQDAGGIWGTENSVTVSVTGVGNGDVTPPPTPTGLAVTSRFGVNYLTWTAPSYTAGGGHSETIVFAATNTGTAPTITAATPIGSVPSPGASYADTVAPGTVRHYWVAHLSKTAVQSAVAGGTNGVSVTTARLGSLDIDNAIIDTAKFASGIEPVTIVTSVPVSKSTSAVFNTTDGKLYRWNGTAYVASVPTTDLSGTISQIQLAAGSVNDTKIAAGAVTAAKLAIRKHIIT